MPIPKSSVLKPLSLILPGLLLVFNFQLIAQSDNDIEKKQPHIFQAKTEFVYQLTILKDSSRLDYDLFQNLVPAGLAKNKVDSIGFRVTGEYSHDQIEIEYVRYLAGEEYTDQRLYSGVIDNDSILWIHPYRGGWFRILNLAPYPQYRRIPNEAAFIDSLRVGGRYLVGTIAEGNEPIWVKSTYHVQKEDNQYLISATSESVAGSSQLLAVYNPEVGFTELKYITVDGVQVTFSLKNIKKQKPQ